MDASLNVVMEGARLALVGMGTVFLFLTLLVIATSLMSRMVASFSSVAGSQNDDSVRSEPDQGQLIAIVAAAIHLHRAKS
jgi:oxaloacetate decarboxylase gamma subunit